jgi:hypothetical protein
MTSGFLATSTSTVTATAKSETTTTATTATTTTTSTTATTAIITKTTSTITIDEAKRGSGSNPGTTVLAVLAVLAVLTFIFAVALLVLVTRIRSLSAQIVILQQGARGNQNRREWVQTTSNPLHQGDANTYEDPVFGQEAIYTQAKLEKAVVAFEEPYEMLESGAQTYAMGTTTATLA